MGDTSSTTVETLTAEVRVLMVGNRQITQSVAKQLDIVDISDVEPFGRVRVGSVQMVIGSMDGQLVVAEIPGIANYIGFIASDSFTYPTDVKISSFCQDDRVIGEWLGHKIAVTYRSRLVNSPITTVTPRIGRTWKFSDRDRNSLERAVDDHLKYKSQRESALELPLIVLAGLR